MVLQVESIRVSSLNGRREGSLGSRYPNVRVTVLAPERRMFKITSTCQAMYGCAGNSYPERIVGSGLQADDTSLIFSLLNADKHQLADFLLLSSKILLCRHVYI